MLVLFDNGTPRTLARHLIGQHAVTEARARRWEQLGNGELLDAAEAAGFDVLVTTDKNLRYQQNLTGRKLAIVVLGKGRWSLIRRQVAAVVTAVNAATPGSYAEVEIPYDWPPVRRYGWAFPAVAAKGRDSVRLAGQPLPDRVPEMENGTRPRHGNFSRGPPRPRSPYRTTRSAGAWGLKYSGLRGY